MKDTHVIALILSKREPQQQSAMYSVACAEQTLNAQLLENLYILDA